jgi:hypothetical protein
MSALDAGDNPVLGEGTGHTGLVMVNVNRLSSVMVTEPDRALFMIRTGYHSFKASKTKGDREVGLFVRSSRSHSRNRNRNGL